MSSLYKHAMSYLLVVEEAQGLAVGRLGENLRAVEQVLSCSRAHGFARTDAFGVIGEAQACAVFRGACKLSALPRHRPATVAVGFPMAS